MSPCDSIQYSFSLSRQGADCFGSCFRGVEGIFNSTVSVCSKISARLEMPLPPTASETLADAQFGLENKIFEYFKLKVFKSMQSIVSYFLI